MQARSGSARIILKFKERTGVRIRADSVQGLAGQDLTALNVVLEKAGLRPSELRRLHARPEAELDEERAEAQRSSRRELADLNLYYTVRVPAGIDAAAFSEQLGKLSVVEYAEPELEPSPLPAGDIAPTTPQFKASQDYREAGDGVGVLNSRNGGDGSGASVVDVEYNWNLNHEDIRLPASSNIDSATLDDPFPSDEANHGTAVLGEIVGKKNAYGVQGLAPGAKVMVAPANTAEFGFSVARAIGIATGKLRKGDVILIEQQAPVCGGGCGSDQVGCGPVEFFQAEFDSISTATAKGITVVEAAGNGNVNLDAPACEGRFDRNVRDSEAVIVGAGDSQTHQKLSFSTFGSRVDVQGWGHNITTTGYGDAFDPGDVRQRYTHVFGGTSGASPIVTGVVLQIQGALKGRGETVALPVEMRRALRVGATKQPSSSTPIGPLPQTENALNWLLKRRGTGGDMAAEAIAAAGQ